MSSNFNDILSKGIEKLLELKMRQNTKVEDPFRDIVHEQAGFIEKALLRDTPIEYLKYDEAFIKEIRSGLSTDIFIWNDLLLFIEMLHSCNSIGYEKFSSIEESIKIEDEPEENISVKVLNFFRDLDLFKKRDPKMNISVSKDDGNSLILSDINRKEVLDNSDCKRIILFFKLNSFSKEINRSKQYCTDRQEDKCENVDFRSNYIFQSDNKEKSSCLMLLNQSSLTSNQFDIISLHQLIYDTKILLIIWIDLLLRNPFKVSDILVPKQIQSLIVFLLHSFRVIEQIDYKKRVLKALSLLCRDIPMENLFKKFIVDSRTSKSIDSTWLNTYNSSMLSSNSTNFTSTITIDRYEYKYFIFNIEVMDIFYYCFIKQLSNFVLVPAYAIDKDDTDTIKRYKLKIITNLSIKRAVYDNYNRGNTSSVDYICGKIAKDDKVDMLSLINLFVSYLNYNDVKVGWTVSKCIFKLSKYIDTDSLILGLKSLLRDEIFADEQQWVNIITILSFLVLDNKDIGSFDFINTALSFDNQFSIKSLAIRESALFLLWALVKTDTDISAFLNKIVFISLFDKELNCRKAAASVVQEYIGRSTKASKDATEKLDKQHVVQENVFDQVSSNQNTPDKNKRNINKNANILKNDLKSNTENGNPSVLNQLNSYEALSDMNSKAEISPMPSEISADELGYYAKATLNVSNRQNNLDLFKTLPNKLVFFNLLSNSLYSYEKSTRCLAADALADIIYFKSCQYSGNVIDLAQVQVKYDFVPEIDGTNRLCDELIRKISEGSFNLKTVIEFFSPWICKFNLNPKTYKIRNMKYCIESYLKIAKYFINDTCYSNLIFLLNKNYDPEQIRLATENKHISSFPKIKEYHKIVFAVHKVDTSSTHTDIHFMINKIKSDHKNGIPESLNGVIQHGDSTNDKLDGALDHEDERKKSLKDVLGYSDNTKESLNRVIEHEKLDNNTAGSFADCTIMKDDSFCKRILLSLSRNTSYILINTNNSKYRSEVISGLISNLKSNKYIDYSIKALRYMNAYSSEVQSAVLQYLEDYSVTYDGDTGYFNRKEALDYFLKIMESSSNLGKSHQNLRSDVNNFYCSDSFKIRVYNDIIDPIALTENGKQRGNSIDSDKNDVDFTIEKNTIRNYLILYLSDKSKYLRDHILSLFASSEFTELSNFLPLATNDTFDMKFDDIDANSLNHILKTIEKYFESNYDDSILEKVEIFVNDQVQDISFKRFFTILATNINSFSFEKAYYKSLFKAFFHNDFFIRGIIQSLAVRGGNTKKIILEEIQERKELFVKKARYVAKLFNLNLPSLDMP